jgi:hypothetical protein
MNIIINDEDELIVLPIDSMNRVRAYMNTVQMIIIVIAMVIICNKRDIKERAIWMMMATIALMQGLRVIQGWTKEEKIEIAVQFMYQGMWAVMYYFVSEI